MIRPAALAAFLAAALMTPAVQALDDRDIIGTWQIDAAAYRRDMAHAFEDYIAEMPEPMRAQMKEMMLGQFDEMYDEEEEAYAEFRPGGEMIFYATDEPAMPGTWRLTGDRIEFARTGQEEDEPAYVGTVVDGVMRVVPDLDMPMEVPLTLRRQ